MSEATPDTGTPDQTTTEEPATGDNSQDLKSELEKWKSQARKHEERAKANAAAAKELDVLRQQSMSDQEKAVATARSEAADEARRTYGGRLVAAEMRVAAAGRSVDVDALLEGIDPARFLGDDGEPDRAAVAAWVERVAPKQAAEQGSGNPLDLGQGTRGGSDMALNGDPLLVSLKSKLGIS